MIDACVLLIQTCSNYFDFSLVGKQDEFIITTVFLGGVIIALLIFLAYKWREHKGRRGQGGENQALLGNQVVTNVFQLFHVRNIINFDT